MSDSNERHLSEVLKKIRQIEVRTKRLVNDVFSG
jgi:hypothetical protein